MSDRLENVDLQLIKLFLDIARCHSYNQAAIDRQEDRSTVKRRIDKLESQLGLKLFNRQGLNVKLTPDGELLRTAAYQFVQSGYSLAATVENIRNTVNAEIWIDAPEGLSSFWVIPSLIDFRVANPGIFLNFDHKMEREKTYTNGFDFLIDYDNVEYDGFTRRVIAYMHLLPFASHSYIARFGYPKTPEEWRNHLFVGQRTSYVSVSELTEVLGVDVDSQPRTITTPSGSAHFHAVQRAGGIGMLPSYMAATAENVEPVPFKKPYTMPIILHYRKDRLKNTAYKMIYEAIKTMFDGNRYPWFAPNFVHPSKFAPLPPSDALIIRPLRLAPTFTAQPDINSEGP